MLTLDESLFVEHKEGFSENKDRSHSLATAIAAFANTLGGWVLINVKDGKPLPGEPDWARDDAPALIDAIRERLRHQVDPLPPFEARVMAHNGCKVGVVRVYESVDTPHFLVSNGAVYVRETAGKEDAATPKPPGSGTTAEHKYKATQIRSRQQLLDLANRGQTAEREARGRIQPASWPPLIQYALLSDARPKSGIVLCVAPLLSAARFRAWATSRDASVAAIETARLLSGLPNLPGHKLVVPHASGLTISTQVRNGAHLVDGGGWSLPGRADIAIDGQGLVGIGLAIGPHPSHESQMHYPRPSRDIKELSEQLIKPVISAGAFALQQGGFIGRALGHVSLIRIPELVHVLGNPVTQPLVSTDNVPVEIEITVPADEGLTNDVACQVGRTLGRALGLAEFDPSPGAH